MTFFNTLSLFLHRKQWLYCDDDGDDKKKMDTSKKNKETMAASSKSSVDKIEDAYIEYLMMDVAFMEIDWFDKDTGY